jgi:hypothetical protein
MDPRVKNQDQTKKSICLRVLPSFNDCILAMSLSVSKFFSATKSWDLPSSEGLQTEKQIGSGSRGLSVCFWGVGSEGHDECQLVPLSYLLVLDAEKRFLVAGVEIGV